MKYIGYIIDKHCRNVISAIFYLQMRMGSGVKPSPSNKFVETLYVCLLIGIML